MEFKAPFRTTTNRYGKKTYFRIAGDQTISWSSPKSAVKISQSFH
jgi:hypothetical protein